MRAGDFIATIIVSQHARIPSLHGDPENDRFRLALLLTPTRGGDDRIIPLASQLRSNEYLHGARMIADDGRLLWFHAHEPMAYDYQSSRLLRGDSLPRTNEPKSRLFSREEAEDYLSREESFPTEYTRAALILSARFGKPLELSEPKSRLLTYRSQPGRISGTILVARIPEAGKPLWTADTGLQFLDQVLPHPETTALIGKKPAESPNKPVGPTLLLIDNATGAVTSHPLWFQR